MADILSSVATAVSLTTRLREIGKHIEDAEFKNVLADLSLELADAKLKISGLVSENTDLKENLRNASEFCPKCNRRHLNFDGHLLWDGSSRFPFCPHCYGEDKFIQMLVMDTNTGGAIDGYCCPVCDKKHIDLP